MVLYNNLPPKVCSILFNILFSPSSRSLPNKEVDSLRVARSDLSDVIALSASLWLRIDLLRLWYSVST